MSSLQLRARLATHYNNLLLYVDSKMILIFVVVE